MKKAEQFLRQEIDESLGLKSTFFDQNLSEVMKLYVMLRRVARRKARVFIFGNGGSAADAQHFAAELVHRVEKTPIGMRAQALHTDTSLITALGNDEGFSSIYARQIEVLASPGDLAIAISTSGNSANIVDGLKIARKKH